MFKATHGLYDQFGEDRALDAPLAESAIAGVAIGAAMYGMRPIAEMQFADFIMPAVNQIVSEAAKFVIVLIMIGLVQLQFVHHLAGCSRCIVSFTICRSDVCKPTRFKIVIPSTPYDAKGLLKAAIRDEDPVLFFEHKRAYRLIKGEVPEDDYVLPIGKADVKREGDDITVITYGLCVHFALQAAEKLAQDGISAHILDLRTVYPLDKEAIIEAASKTGKVLLVTEDNKEGSIMSEVAAIIAENCLFDLDAPIARLAGPDVPAMPYAPTMEKFFMVNPDKVEKAMRELAEF